ncbi:MAG TPA: secretin N-terminal domain-containing protein [Verrucomicrobiae bacterium]|nr:secretin N-terminal domain-containing protein [Verrucomicrobiae bacterium]
MKRKINSLIVSGLLLGQLAVSAQDNQSVSADTTNNTQPATEAAAPVEATQSQPVAEPVAETPAPVETETVAATPVADSSNAVTIPLIVMDEVPLTDAIKNLARQANINYMLDPKINFGQPGPDGRPVPQPNVSIRWENISAGQALNALLNNYGLQLIEDQKTKISRVTVKDPAAPDPLITKIIQLKYASPSNMLASVQTALVDKRSKIMPDVRTSQLVVLATEKELDTLDKLIERLDTPTKQVLIEARLLETRINPTSIKGIDWTGTLAAQHATFGNNALPGTPAQTTPVLDPGGSGTVIGSTTTPGTIGGILNGVGGGSGLLGSLSKGSFFQPATAFMNADGVSLVLSFLNNNAETKILSSPRTVTLDNETAHIEVGQQYPIINVTAGTANTTGGSSISYSNLTVALDVTPRISANDFINLKVSPHAMRLQQVQKFTAGGQSFDVPIFDTRMIDTSVMIPSGHTLVMGGLMEDDVAMQNTKVPLLGDIPGLGYLFRKDSKSRTKQNLIIFITPTIVQAGDFQTTKTEFLKTPVPKSDSLEKDWSAWDSGKPRDWSKPAKFQDFSTQ